MPIQKCACFAQSKIKVVHKGLKKQPNYFIINKPADGENENGSWSIFC